MNEERRMILQMLREGQVSVEEAERLLDAVPEDGKPEELVLAPVGGVMPKRLVVRVTEGGRAKVNVRLPFSLVKIGLKLGLSFGSIAAKNSDDPEARRALEMLKDIDINEILESIAEGETSLPYTIVDVDDEENGGHVQVMLQ